MKRILIWILILFTPASLWFAFTEDGNDAFQMWFGESKNNIAVRNAPLNINRAAKINVDGANGKRILIPAHAVNKSNQKPQLPFLHVEMKGRNTSSRKVPAGLLVIDSKGRRTGYDPINKHYYQEIPNSKYSVKMEPRVSPPSEIAVISVNPVEPQYYRIEVIGQQSITYQLSVSRLPSQRSRMLMTMPHHVINRGELHSYSVNLINNSKDRFLGAMAEEPISASFSRNRNVMAEAINSADMNIDVSIPTILFDTEQQDMETQLYINEVSGFRLAHSISAELKFEFKAFKFGEGADAVIMKVLPYNNDPYQRQFNKTHNSIQSFAAYALPRSVGITADGDGYGIHPVGIIGTKPFINKKGVKGIQTFVVHEEQRYEEGMGKPDISYVLQGPVYLFDLKPELPVSPVLVISAAGPAGSNFESKPEKVFEIANSLELTE